MTDVTRCPDPDTLLILLYGDEGTPAERAALQGHVARCPQCAELLTSLDSARGALGAWHAPRLPLGFAFVRQERSTFRSVLLGGGLAAAAALVLAAAASIAQLDVTFDANGFRMRTGTSRPAVGAGAADAPSVPASSTAQGNWVGAASVGEPPWRQDMDLLATQIRADVSRLIQESPRAPSATPLRVAMPLPAAPAPTMTDAELLARVQELIDKSEIRQQSNLALRVTELGRQFELQRQGDIVQVEQALQRLEQQRSDLLRRVVAQQPRP